jgi:hypothetical protein
MNISAAQSLVSDVEARNFSTDKRKKMAKSGTALPDGSFPIANEGDVHNAVGLLHHAKNPTAAKAHIRSRAKALGMGDPFGDVKAGGPGSGPRPVGGGNPDVYHMHQYLTSPQGGFKHNMHYGHGSSYTGGKKGDVHVSDAGSWHHTANDRSGRTLGKGTGLDSFNKHFGVK